jgi:hypothetical protein
MLTRIIQQQLWGYKVEEKLYLGVREQKRLNTTALQYTIYAINITSVIHARPHT